MHARTRACLPTYPTPEPEPKPTPGPKPKPTPGPNLKPNRGPKPIPNPGPKPISNPGPKPKPNPGPKPPPYSGRKSYPSPKPKPKSYFRPKPNPGPKPKPNPDPKPTTSLYRLQDGLLIKGTKSKGELLELVATLGGVRVHKTSDHVECLCQWFVKANDELVKWKPEFGWAQAPAALVYRSDETGDEASRNAGRDARGRRARASRR
eukprot:6210100-Pleurochrysis_carterae.AAC.2